MKQVLVGRTYGNLGNAPLYTTLRGYQWSQHDVDPTYSTFRHSHPWSVAGTFKNFYVEMLAPVENAASLSWTATTFYLVKNGVDTALSVTVPAAGPVAQNGFQASSFNSSDSVTVTPGDILSIRRTSGTITGNTNAAYANMDWSLTFESTNVKESGYAGGSRGTKINGASNLYWCPPLNCNLSSFSTVASPDSISQVGSHSIVPLAGSLFRIDMTVSDVLGANSVTFFCYKNGVKQDGSGGTVDTHITLTGSGTSFSTTFDLPLAVLDLLSIHIDTSMTVGTVNSYVSVGVGFRATTDGQSAFCFSDGGNPVRDGSTDWSASEGSGWAWTTANSPTPAPSWRPNRWPSTELLISYPGGIDPFTLSGFCVNVDTFPGAAKSYLFTTRKASADTASTVTMTGATDPDSRLLTDPMNASVSYAGVSDRLNIQAVASGTPAAIRAGWTWLMTGSTTPAANLTIIKSHTDPFYQGQNGATYQIVASNTGDADTSGTQTVTDTIPSGLTLVSMAGTGWVCIANVCTRSDVLAPGASYPPITVTVNVASNATSPQINLANNVIDTTIIVPPRVGYRYIMKVRAEDRVFPVAPERPPHRIMKVSQKRT